MLPNNGFLFVLSQISFSLLIAFPRIAWTVEAPDAIPTGMLIEVTRYLDSLQYNVWKKMLDIIKVGRFLRVVGRRNLLELPS